MTVAEIRQQLEGLPDDLGVMIYDLYMTECYSIDAIDVLCDGADRHPVAVEFNFDSKEYDKEVSGD